MPNDRLSREKIRQLHESRDELTQIVMSMGRPSWDDTFMLIANVWSWRATCPRRSVGCVLVSRDHRILSTGYNGAPRGLPHCAEDGCVLDGLGRCTRAVHAEANAIFQASRQGTNLLGSMVYCTDRPCINCAMGLIQIGIASIMWSNDEIHADEREAVVALFGQAGIEMRVYKLTADSV